MTRAFCFCVGCHRLLRLPAPVEQSVHGYVVGWTASACSPECLALYLLTYPHLRLLSSASSADTKQS